MSDNQALIYQSELDFISRCVMDYPDSETGGDFFGSFTRDGKIKIEYVIGPGINTNRTQHSFFQDIDYLKSCGSLLHNKFGLQHIGAWHSHHRLSLYQPSSGDINTMKNALQNGNLPLFLISICNIDRNNSVVISPFMFTRNNSVNYIPYKWQVLQGISPFREKLSREGINLFTEPKSDVSSSRINIEVKDDNSIQKPLMPSDSYWKTDVGKNLLKETYESLQHRNHVSEVEILQKKDNRIAIRFKLSGLVHEMILPHNFPNQPIEVSILSNEQVFSQIEIPLKKQRHFPSDMDVVLRFIEKKFRKKLF